MGPPPWQEFKRRRRTSKTVIRTTRAARCDGVELHVASGYLQDQFLQDGSSQRTDACGSAAGNRARLMLDTAAAMVGACDAGRFPGERAHV